MCECVSVCIKAGYHAPSSYCIRGTPGCFTLFRITSPGIPPQFLLTFWLPVLLTSSSRAFFVLLLLIVCSSQAARLILSENVAALPYIPFGHSIRQRGQQHSEESISVSLDAFLWYYKMPSLSPLHLFFLSTHNAPQQLRKIMGRRGKQFTVIQFWYHDMQPMRVMQVETNIYNSVSERILR